MTKKEYQKKKNRAMDLAVQWQWAFDKKCYDWASVLWWGQVWHSIGKHYGLLREFKNNGII